VIFGVLKVLGDELQDIIRQGHVAAHSPFKQTPSVRQPNCGVDNGLRGKTMRLAIFDSEDITR